MDLKYPGCNQSRLENLSSGCFTIIKKSFTQVAEKLCYSNLHEVAVIMRASNIHWQDFSLLAMSEESCVQKPGVSGFSYCTG